ncbi:MAG: 50S ribosomal protein L1 [Patescibacteria group bacterium]
MTSKRFKEAKTQIDPKMTYTIEEALKLAKETSKIKFDASIDVHCRLGIDPKKSEEAIRSTITLPHSSGKTKRVIAFVEAEKEAEAKMAGADIVGGEDLINEIASKGKIDFDVAVATPGMMAKLAKAAKILGPRGLMPNPKTDTVGLQIAKIITEQKAGKLSFKNDDTGNVHVTIGRVSMDVAHLVENFNAYIEALKKTRRPSSKGIFIPSCTIVATMGPAIRVTVT